MAHGFLCLHSLLSLHGFLCYKLHEHINYGQGKGNDASIGMYNGNRVYAVFGLTWFPMFIKLKKLNELSKLNKLFDDYHNRVTIDQ